MPQRQILSLDLGALKARVAECAARDGMAPAPWARHVLARQVGDVASPTPAQPLRSAQGWVQFGGRLSPATAATLEASAAAAGLSRIEYVARLIDGDMAGRGRTEMLAALSELAARLTVIERDLGRIARGLKSSSPDPVDAKEMIRSVAELRRVSKRAAAAMGTLSTNRRSVAQRGRS